ncbi:hypothetical protein TNCV_1458211 [Trichonephila clavipes]|nr:hypothetical protein TNCV_1458211 [Trichonephila clavipes]
MMAFGGRPGPIHGRRSSHNKKVLPLLPVDISSEISSRERDEAATEAEAQGPGTVGPLPLALRRSWPQWPTI